MNNKYIPVITFAIGLGLGAFVANLALRGKYEDLVQEEIDSIRQTRWKGSDEVSINNCNAVDNGVITEEETIEEKKLVQNKDKYVKIARVYNTEASRNVVEVSNTNPYIISIEEFTEEHDNFDKVNLYYYSEDDTLAGENEEVIVDPNSIIGEDALFSFGDQSNNGNTVYVRNEKLSIDYEIICLYSSYSKTVLGMNEEDFKR